jgi:hypothetical protein
MILAMNYSVKWHLVSFFQLNESFAFDKVLMTFVVNFVYGMDLNSMHFDSIVSLVNTLAYTQIFFLSNKFLIDIKYKNILLIKEEI